MDEPVDILQPPLFTPTGEVKMREQAYRDGEWIGTQEDAIGFYLDGSYVFDSFAPFQIEWRGKHWATAEHAYQAAHFMDEHPELAEGVRLAKSPRAASDLANQNPDRDRKDWVQVKAQVMQDICKHKLLQHEYIQKLLLQTGDKQIIEMSPHDSFWGWGPDKQGRNELGQIWMRLRNGLKNGTLR